MPEKFRELSYLIFEIFSYPFVFELTNFSWFRSDVTNFHFFIWSWSARYEIVRLTCTRIQSCQLLLCIRASTKRMAVSNIFLLLRHIIHGKFWSHSACCYLHLNQNVNCPFLEAHYEPQPIRHPNKSYS
jgi:hypothetical protein